jgi:hypothetical protein
VRRTLLDDPEQRAALDLRLADWLATQRSEASSWRTSTDVAAQRVRSGTGYAPATGTALPA